LTAAWRSESLSTVIRRRTGWLLATSLVASCGGSSLKGADAGATDAAEAGDVAAGLKVGLAGAWSFDGDGADHSGNKLDLGVTGLRFGAGKFGKGIQFAGERTPIAQRPLADASLDLTTGDFTVSFWIDFAMTASAQFVALKGYGSAGWFVGWAQTAWAYGLPKGGTFVPPGGSPTPGTFHHVVFERAVDMIQIFVDGTSVGTATAVAGGPSTDPFQVGGYAPGGVTVATAQSVVDGTVDDLAIWHRALTSAEIAYLGAHAVP
jgi:hypothetical protein